MPQDRPYQQCTLTVMDTIADPNITFDAKGICNYYYEYQQKEKQYVLHGAAGEKMLRDKVAEIKAVGKNQQYDCILGVSGGVDSTYLALQAKKLGLRPLLVHFDNGWNSELAVMNVQNIVEKCGFDLYTYVINWEEFRDIQLAFLEASVIDIEAITDIAIFTVLDQLTTKHNIRYSINGMNVVTEAILPGAWIYKDPINIKAIHSQYGKVPLKTYPFMSPWRMWYAQNVKKVESVMMLNWMPYIKSEVKKTIIDELNWRDYGGKHYESVFTRFYQGYILPTKFKVDKRKAHLSTLICSGQMTKEEALEELKQPIYDAEQCKIDMEFVLKKFDLTQAQFDDFMSRPPRDHREYATRKPFFEQYPLLKPLRGLSQIAKKALRGSR